MPDNAEVDLLVLGIDGLTVNKKNVAEFGARFQRPRITLVICHDSSTGPWETTEQ